MDKKNISKNLNINDLNNSDSEEKDDYAYDYENNEKLELLTLNNLSICQLCKNIFDNKDHVPYLFKCGHFFCKSCILNELINSEKKIFCPNHGNVANSIKELKILSNFICNKEEKKQTIEEPKLNFCDIHKGMKLTHVIEGTKKIFCIYCAIDLCKKDPNLKINEINEVLNDYKDEIESIINSSYNNLQKIKSLINFNNKEKNNEIEKLNIYFKKIFEIINLLQNKVTKKFETVEKKNNDLLNNKIKILTSIIEKCSSIKYDIENNQNNYLKYLEIFDDYSNIKKLNSENINIINDIDKQLFKYSNIFDKGKINDILIQLKNIKLNNNNNNKYNKKMTFEKSNYEKLKLKEFLDDYKKKDVSNNNYFYSYNISHINNSSFISNDSKQTKEISRYKLRLSSSCNKININKNIIDQYNNIDVNKKASFNTYNDRVYNNYNDINNKYNNFIDDMNENTIILKTNNILNKNDKALFNFK